MPPGPASLADKLWLRVTVYLLIGLIATWLLSRWNDVSWPNQMRHDIFPWLVIAIIPELLLWHQRRKSQNPNH